MHLTLEARLPVTVVTVKLHTSGEYRHDEILKKELRTSFWGVQLMPQAREKDARKDHYDLYLEPTLVSLAEKAQA